MALHRANKSASTRVRAVVLTALLSVCLGVNQKAAAAVPAGLDDFVRQYMKDHNVPGVCITIVEGDKVTVRGYGVRSVDKPGAVDGDTVFMLASNSKPFTSALAGIIVDDGKIGWDDHIVDKYPSFALHDMYATRKCTLRDLLAHRSGLPAFYGDCLEVIGFSRDEIMSKLKDIEPAWSFREKDGYSNPGITAAGVVAATLGGGTYESQMHQRIFSPLGMTRTAIAVKSADLVEGGNAAEAHTPLPGNKGSKVVPWDNPSPLAPAGAISTSGKDMGPWLRMQVNEGKLDGKQIISAKTICEMHTPAMVAMPGFAELAPIDDNSGFSFALGWDVYHYQGYKIVEKAGARMGFRSSVTLIPEKKIGISVLANQNMTVLPEAVRAYLMTAMVAPTERDLQAEIRTSEEKLQKMFGAAAVSPPTNVHATSLPLEKYQGEYSNKLFGVVRVFAENGKLRWQAGPHKITGPLEPIAYDTFLLRWPEGGISLPEEVTFTLAPAGYPSSLTTESFGVLSRVAQPDSPTSPAH